jgi:hypothetical protein
MITPLVNGISTSWNNVSLVLFGVPVVGITKIEYKAKQKKENNYGFGNEPINRGYGNKEYEGKITLYKDEWNAILAAAPGRDPLAIGYFDIQVVFSGNGITSNVDILHACEFTEDPFTVGQGDTKVMIELPLIIAKVEHLS